MNDTTAELQARQAILDGMYWYCSALSRLDRDQFARSFHESATLQYPFFEGPWEKIRELLFDAFGNYTARTMQMAQAMIVFGPDGTTATAESYVTATFWRAGQSAVSTFLPDQAEAGAPDLARQVTQGTQDVAMARYADRWSVVDGRWALDHRRAVVDFYTSTPAEGWIGDGRGDRDDASYALAGFGMDLSS